MASIFLDLVAARTKTQSDTPCQVFHLTNPKLADWSSLLPSVQKYLDAEPVPFERWVEILEKTPSTPEEIAKKPGLKLLDFWGSIAAQKQQMATISTEVTCATSETMRKLLAVDSKLIELFIRQLGL